MADFKEATRRLLTIDSWLNEKSRKNIPAEKNSKLTSWPASLLN